MKKLLLIIAAAATLMACEGPPGRDGMNGLNGLPGEGFQRLSDTFTVRKNQWSPYPSIENFECWTYVRRINGFSGKAFTDGQYSAYIKKLDDYGRTGWEPLGVIIYNVNENDYLWSENIACAFYEGEMHLFFRPSDFEPEGVPWDMDFRYMIMW